MARRARSSANPAWFAAVIVLVLLLAGSGYWISQKISDPFRTLPPFPLSAYLENSNSLRGNVYSVTGSIDNQLGWSPEVGRLYAIQLDRPTNVIPILIPKQFNATNLQKGQKFVFEIEVTEKGILQARQLKKA